MTSLLLILAACNGDDGTDTDVVSTGDTSPASPWEIAADQVPGGVMLAAWTDPGTDEVLVVGGGIVGGTGTLWRYDGDTLCYEEDVADQPLWWIHGTGADEWVAVGAGGAVLRSSAGTRTRDDVPTEATLFGVYDSGTEVWAVGGDVTIGTGEVWRQPDGGAWEKVADTDRLLFKVWGEWIVGDSQAWRWDGSQLVDALPPGSNRLMTVRGTSAEDVWAVGDGVSNTEVHHFSDGSWSSPELEPRCTGQGLNGVWTGPGEDVWVAGYFGLMAQLEGDEWHCPDNPLTAEHFHAAWRWHDETLFFGGNLYATSGHYGTVGRYGGQGPIEVTACL